MNDTPMQRPLVIDVAGVALTPADRLRLAHPGVGGVIHFARNWQDRAQLCALNAEIKAIRPDILVSVDHEGGRVQRFRTDGFTRLPSMRTLGTLWMSDPMRAIEAATATGQVLAGELRACGVDFSFAPVLDLNNNPRNPVVRDLLEETESPFCKEIRMATMPERLKLPNAKYNGTGDPVEHLETYKS